MKNKKTDIAMNEQDFVKRLNCDELCVISSKKEQNKQVKQQKTELAKNEMYDKLCPPCK